MRGIFLAAALAALSGTALAGTTGPYIAAGAGVNFPTRSLSDEGNTQLDFDAGAVALGSIGWGFGNGFRAELEGSERWNATDRISTLRANGALVDLTEPSGHVARFGAMANLLYDIDVPVLPFTPYFGAGIGYGWQQYAVSGNGLARFQLPNQNTVVSPSHVNLSGTAGAFAYQAIGGASVPLPFVPGLAATFEYRYFATESATIPVNRVAAGVGNTVNGIRPSSHTTNSFSAHDHALLLGCATSSTGCRSAEAQ